MNVNPLAKSKQLKTTFRINMLLGFVVTLIACYLIITGHYSSIQAREAAESLMGTMAIGGLLYLLAFWYLCLFRHQLFFDKE